MKAKRFNIKNWNGKVYGMSAIYLNNAKIEVSLLEAKNLMLAEANYTDIAKQLGVDLNELPFATRDHMQERFDLVNEIINK